MTMPSSLLGAGKEGTVETWLQKRAWDSALSPCHQNPRLAFHEPASTRGILLPIPAALGAGSPAPCHRRDRWPPRYWWPSLPAALLSWSLPKAEFP